MTERLTQQQNPPLLSAGEKILLRGMPAWVTAGNTMSYVERFSRDNLTEVAVATVIVATFGLIAGALMERQIKKDRRQQLTRI